MLPFCPRSWAWGLRHRERAARPVCSSSSRMLGECIAGHIPPGALQRQRLVLRLALIERVPLSSFRGKGLSCASWTAALFDSLGAWGAETCAAVKDILSTHPLPLPPCSYTYVGSRTRHTTTQHRMPIIVRAALGSSRATQIQRLVLSTAPHGNGHASAA